MRIITGDECGLLKESIPELSRPTNINNVNNNGIHKEGEKQLSFLMNFGISRINNSDVSKMCRSKGVVDLSFCHHSTAAATDAISNDGVGPNESGKFGFCALRANGSLEHWQGSAPCQTREDRLCGGSYNLIHTVQNIFDHVEKDSSSSSSSTVVGRPIAMSTSLQYQKGSTLETSNANIIACCSSTGLVSILDSNQLDKGVVAHYDAYSKKGNDDNKVRYLKGKLANNDISTAMAMDYDSKRIVLGGRERAATMLDVESGEKIWKVRY